MSLFEVGDRVKWLPNEAWLGTVVEGGDYWARVHWDARATPELTWYSATQLRHQRKMVIEEVPL